MTTGLTTAEARARLEEFGPNTLPSPQLPGIPLIFFRQFLSPLIYILLAAAAVSFAMGEGSDAIFIFIVLLLNALIGTIQEASAQRAAASLNRMVPAFATVLRDGKTLRIEAEKLVPGDIVLLESGDKVPADIQLSKAQDFFADESLLTGESLAVEKDASRSVPPETPLSQRTDMAFAGSMAARGRAQGVVTATGPHTELGAIAKSVAARSIAKPPLLRRMERFTLWMAFIILGIIAAMFVTAWLQGGDLKEMFLIAVALAVSAIPEGLPAAITVALAIGMRRMAARNVIIRKLLAVESLGSCTMIASDKTGTLTVNELTVRKVVLPDGTHFDVTGEGMAKGKILPLSGQGSTERLLRAGIFANEATVNDKGEYQGDKVDIAFLVLATKAGMSRDELLRQHPQISCIPYESERACSASIREDNGRQRIYVKGSPEKVLALCPSADKRRITEQMEQLAGSGYKVLALADGEGDALQNLTFLGLVGMIDPLRSEAREAVALCRKAGIQVAMITGDHPVTARAIAYDLGLCEKDCRTITGPDIKKALAESRAALDRLVEGNHVFARIEPNQKREIVESMMRLGHFVAVTGDGVNDAPALKHAHVGIAMGKRGTDVARESADLIITDDDFASIVNGIHEGRVAYANIRKVIFMLVSTGAAEIMLFILALLFGLPMPLLAVQLLWLNLVTNGIQDVALAFEPAEGDELDRAPRHPDEPIFDRVMITRVVLSGLFMGGLAFAVFSWLVSQGHTVEYARNATLLLMVLFENMQALNARSETHSVFRQHFFGNRFLLIAIVAAQAIHIAAMHLPGIREVLALQPVTLAEWASLLLMAAILLGLDEVYRVFLGNRNFRGALKHHNT